MNKTFEKPKNLFDFATNPLNNSILSYQHVSSKNGKEKKNKEISQTHYQNFWMNPDISKSQQPNILEGFINNEIMADNLDLHDTNMIKFTNRSILSKLNKFCSYDFTQTNALIPHICIPNDKKLQNNSNPSIIKPTNPQITQEFLKKVVNVFFICFKKIKKFLKKMSNHENNISHKAINETEDTTHKANHNMRNLSEDNYGGSLVNFQNGFPNFYSETQSISHESFMGNYHNQRPNQSETRTPNYQEKISNNLPISPISVIANEIAHNEPLKNVNSLNKLNKFVKKKSKKNSEKKAQSAINNEKNQAKSNIPLMNGNLESQDNNGTLVKNLNFQPKNFSKTESSSFPQQFFNIMPVEKDMRNNRPAAACNIQQFYPNQYRPNTYFYNPPQENSYMNNNNMISSNNYCFTGNNNPYVGVNYPNMQNISFSKPNNYPNYGVMEMGNDGNNNQYGINYLNERNFGEKQRNGEYWKQPFYPYNGQN